ncbi:unnamed protein product [Protopolystoma xenopodis]|uniref:Uncharacterized protein n=1 Tax=Protopolystoma xenopodis TaxID=117903 RepID=A0A3S5AV10_9PLAT|nr:unnamed protein product [Protopolystoma xenopodis]
MMLEEDTIATAKIAVWVAHFEVSFKIGQSEKKGNVIKSLQYKQAATNRMVIPIAIRPALAMLTIGPPLRLDAMHPFWQLLQRRMLDLAVATGLAGSNGCTSADSISTYESP